MNLFLLAPALGCVFEVIRNEMSEVVRACERELSSQNMRERAFEGVDYISFHVTRPAPNTRSIFT